MKKLVISLKTIGESLDEFTYALTMAKQKNGKVTPHYEIAFDNKADFEKFVKNINILMCIQSFNPGSIYELAKIIGKDQSNINKLIIFYETVGALKLLVKKIKGRLIKKPIIDYDTIEFNLKAA